MSMFVGHELLESCFWMLRFPLGKQSKGQRAVEIWGRQFKVIHALQRHRSGHSMWLIHS